MDLAEVSEGVVVGVVGMNVCGVRGGLVIDQILSIFDEKWQPVD